MGIPALVAGLIGLSINVLSMKFLHDFWTVDAPIGIRREALSFR
jgi:hypothetical protein